MKEAKIASKKATSEVKLEPAESKQINTIDLKEALKSHFGFEGFKDEQEKIIHTLLSGDDVFVIMPTGGGKSLCYQLPALIKGGTAIIISPLIALMKNQVDAIRNVSENDSVAHFLNSSLTKTEITQVRKDIQEGKLGTSWALWDKNEKFKFKK